MVKKIIFWGLLTLPFLSLYAWPPPEDILPPDEIVTSSFYATIRLGDGWANKKITAGPTFHGTGEDLPTTVLNDRGDGIVGELKVGYMFNPYFAMELGGGLMPTFHTSISGTSQSGTLEQRIFTHNPRTASSEFDFLFKLTGSVGNFYGFVAAGPILIYGHADALFYTAGLNLGGQLTYIDYELYHHRSFEVIRPKVQVGLGVTFYRNVDIDLSLTKIWGTGTPANSYYIASYDLIELGFTYKFNL